MQMCFLALVCQSCRLVWLIPLLGAARKCWSWQGEINIFNFINLQCWYTSDLHCWSLTSFSDWMLCVSLCECACNCVCVCVSGCVFMFVYVCLQWYFAENVECQFARFLGICGYSHILWWIPKNCGNAQNFRILQKVGEKQVDMEFALNDYTKFHSLGLDLGMYTCKTFALYWTA